MILWHLRCLKYLVYSYLLSSVLSYLLLFWQLLLDIFAEEWNAIAQFNKFTGTVHIRFELQGVVLVLNFKDLVMASLEMYMSIGGEFELNNKSNDYFLKIITWWKYQHYE